MNASNRVLITQDVNRFTSSETMLEQFADIIFDLRLAIQQALKAQLLLLPVSSLPRPTSL